MEKTQITEDILILLKTSTISFNVMYLDHFEKKGIKKSEYASCIRDLKKGGLIDYEGNFNDDADVVLTSHGEQILKKHRTYKTYLDERSGETLYDRTLRWFKNNPVGVIILLIFLLVGAIAAFKDNISKICNDKKKEQATLVIHKDTVQTYLFESVFADINTRVEERLRRDSFVIDKTNPTCRLELLFDSCQLIDLNGTANGWQHYCSEGNVKLRFCGRVPAEIDIKIPKTVVKNSIVEARKAYHDNCRQCIINNFDQLYDAVKKELHR